MAKFTYISRDLSGQKVTAVAEADNRQDLISRLKTHGLTVVEIQELNQATGSFTSKAKGLLAIEIYSKPVSTGELAIFWRQFATMIQAGLAIIEAMESIATEMAPCKLKNVLTAVVQRMWDGFSLSDSLRQHPKVFSPMVTSLIGAAEESGSLPQVLNQLATYLENRDRLIRKVIAALTYPIFLIAFFIAVIAFANIWVIPQFRGIYEQFDATLPWLTETVFAANAVFLKLFPFLVAGSILGIIVLGAWVRKPTGRAFMDQLIMKLPIFGSLFQRAGIARLCRSLSILISGGIAINRALEMAEETTGNVVLTNAIKAAREEILKGSKIADALRKQPIVPKMAVRMIAAGEETGNISELLEKTADFYESQVDAVLTTLNSLIEPVIIVLIGAFVLVFVLSLYMPLFSLASQMKG